MLTLPPAMLAWWLAGGVPSSRKPITVGILHSLSGPMAEEDKPLIDAELAAIEGINRAGGLLGRRVRWVIADGGSDAATFARRADRLIREDAADVLVGGGPDALRRAIVPVVEDAGQLLLFPRRHEGFEESEAVVSLGPLPNQLIGPTLAWCREALPSETFFLVKGDATWMRSAAAFANDQLTISGARIVGDADFGGGERDAATVVERILSAAPDVLCCFMPRDSCVSLLRRLRESGIGSADTAIMLLALDEEDIQALPPEDVTGAYVAAPFFQSVAAGANRPRPDAARGAGMRSGDSASGADGKDSARTLSARESIHLWAAAVRACGTADVGVVRAAICRQTLDSVEGVVAVDASNRHAWRNAAVGRVRADGTIEQVWSSSSPIRPAPFPSTRPRAEWMRFLSNVEKGRATRGDGGERPSLPATPKDDPAEGTR